MDISIIGKNSIKLKGKHAVFVVDPSKDISKTSADAIILLNGNENIDITRVADSRLTINGSGGYEIAGAKISATRTDKGILYRFSIDDTSTILGSPAESKFEGFNACQVAIINAGNEFNESLVTALEPKIAILYGEKKDEAAKALGATNLTSVSKITIAKDKLPEKMEVVVLG